MTSEVVFKQPPLLQNNSFSKEESPEIDESKDSIDFNENLSFFNEAKINNKINDLNDHKSDINKDLKNSKDIFNKIDYEKVNINDFGKGCASDINNININNNSILLQNANAYFPLFNEEYKDIICKNEKINNNFPKNNIKSNINTLINHYNNNINNTLLSFTKTPNNIMNINNANINNINNINIQKYFPSMPQSISANTNINFDIALGLNNNNNAYNTKKNKKNNQVKYLNSKKRGNNYNNEIINFNIFADNLNMPLDVFICSQIGSRILQNNLLNFSYQIITDLINKIKPYFEKLMSDIYGNYFCQKLYLISSFEQRLLILDSIKNSFISISKTKSGSHVAQSIIENVTTFEEKKKIMSFMKNFELDMAIDEEGTHVLQKIIQVFPENDRQSLTDVLCKSDSVNILYKDLKGISVIKRLISFNKEEKNRIKLVDALYDNCLNIIKTSSGSYILQFLLEEWGLDTGIKLVYFSIYNFETFARYKHGANFINKIIILSLKKCSINRFFVNGSNLVFVKTAIIIINALKNIILDYNKIINVYKYKYGKTLIYNIRKLFSNSENEKFYLYIQSLGPLTKDFDTKKYQIYSEIYKSNNSITL